MTLVRPLTRSVSSALVLSLLGATVTQTLEQQVDEILETEAVSGDAVAQYNQQDLTSLFVETDGSGGNPSVGDSVGFIADTARFEGKTFDQFVSGQTELVTNSTFSTDSDWTKGTGWTISGGSATHTGAGGDIKQTLTGLTIGETYLYEYSLDATGDLTLSNTSVQIRNSANTTTIVQKLAGELTANAVNTGYLIFEATETSHVVRSYSEDDVSITLLSIRHIPGYHLIAASDAARPVLLDSFDQSGAALTDNGGRGEELVSNGTFDSDISGWTDSLNAVSSWDAGRISVVSGADARDKSYQDLTTEIGAVYEVKLDVPADSGSGDLRAVNGTNFLNSVLLQQSLAADNSYTVTFRAIGTSTRLGVGGGGSTLKADNISVKRISTAFDGQANLVTNGTFDTDTDWTKGTGWSIGSGVATRTNTGTFSNLSQNMGATDAVWYRVLIYVSNYTAASLVVRIGDATSGSTIGSVSANGWHVLYGRCVGTGAALTLVGETTWAADIDNVIVQEVPSSIERIYFLSTDGSDDQIETDFTGSSSDTIVMAVRTSDTVGMLVNTDNINRYIGIYDGGSSSVLSFNVGAPSFRLDGAAIAPATRAAFRTLIADGNWHVFTVTGANLSSALKLVFGFRQASDAFNIAMDLAYAVILPDPSAEDLATIEQAAAAACGVTLA